MPALKKSRTPPVRKSEVTLKHSEFSVHPFATWDDYKHGVRSALPGAHDFDVYKRFLFRGQGNADWQLRSTFDRNYSDAQAASRDTLAKELIRDFYDECARFSRLGGTT